MRRLLITPIIFTFLLVACSSSIKPVDQTGVIEKNVMAVLERQTEAWNRGDLETFVADYEKSTTFISGGTVIRGRAALLDRYRTAYPEKTRGRLSFSELEMTVLADDAAHMIGRYSLDNGSQEEATGRFTLLFGLRQDRWVILHDHSSAAPSQQDAE
jgi:uncharacterized protein (TIGR02246 family)